MSECILSLPTVNLLFHFQFHHPPVPGRVSLNTVAGFESLSRFVSCHFVQLQLKFTWTTIFGKKTRKKLKHQVPNMNEEGAKKHSNIVIYHWIRNIYFIFLFKLIKCIFIANCCYGFKLLMKSKKLKKNIPYIFKVSLTPICDCEISTSPAVNPMQHANCMCIQIRLWAFAQPEGDGFAFALGKRKCDFEV